MKKFIPFLFIPVLFACNKDKFQTKPQMEIVSYNTKHLPPNAELIMDLKFTDKEGDLGSGEFTYIPVRLNRRRLPQDQDYVPITIPIPEFNDHSKGEFQLKIEWKYLHKSDQENDTVNFKFAAVDRAGNRSDTIQSDQVVILRQ